MITADKLTNITQTALKNQELLQSLNSRPASQAEIRQVERLILQLRSGYHFAVTMGRI